LSNYSRLKKYFGALDYFLIFNFIAEKIKDVKSKLKEHDDQILQIIQVTEVTHELNFVNCF